MAKQNSNCAVNIEDEDILVFSSEEERRAQTTKGLYLEGVGLVNIFLGS